MVPFYFLASPPFMRGLLRAPFSGGFQGKPTVFPYSAHWLTCCCSAGTEGMTSTNHPLWFPLRESPGSFHFSFPTCRTDRKLMAICPTACRRLSPPRCWAGCCAWQCWDPSLLACRRWAPRFDRAERPRAWEGEGREGGEERGRKEKRKRKKEKNGIYVYF